VKVLILGGTGLISTGVTRLLLERGETVWHFNRGQRSQEFAGQVTTIIGDRYAHAGFEHEMAGLPRFDAVLDMIGYSRADAESLIRAFEGRCGHLVFCSTVDVYARPASTYPVRENEPFRPADWEYAQKKAECERLLWAWHDRTQHSFTVLRPVHTYDDHGAMLHTFGRDSYHLDRLMRGKPIIVHGDGSSLWSSVHRDDAAVAFANALGNPAAFGNSYHLPGDECIPWNQIHQRVAEGIGAPRPTLVHMPIDLLVELDRRAFVASVNFSHNNCFDPTAARRDLAFRYTIPIVEGARRVYDTLLAAGKLRNSDEVPEDDRILAAWQAATAQMKRSMRA
jgi:nucleoside-diphosphate-sugar epimerase